MRHISRPKLILLLLLLALIGLGSGTYLYSQYVRAQYDVPTVLMTGPAPGSNVPAGTFVEVTANVTGRTPITRAELWLDGEVKALQNSQQPKGLVDFYAQFDLLVPDGPHTFSVRAVNARNMIGQSLPFGITGEPRVQVEKGKSSVQVKVAPGQSLLKIASMYDVDPATIKKANPGLVDPNPVPGTVVTVPIPPPPAVSGPTGAPGPSTAPGNSPKAIPSTPPLQPLQPLPIAEIPLLKALEPLSFLNVEFILTAFGGPPSAPTDLKGEVVYGESSGRHVGLSSVQPDQVLGCHVILTWNDVSKNESRYEVWTAMNGFTPQLVATLAPNPAGGLTWYRFFAPQAGWVPFWVEAVNGAGSTPSPDVTLYIDPQKCGTPMGAGQYLIVQLFDATLTGSYDKFYCYVSYEGAPEIWVPKGTYVPVKGNKASFGGQFTGIIAPQSNSPLVPIPKDGTLDVSGHCLAWSGKTLNDKMGDFAGHFSSLDWDGARRTMQSTNYKIEIAIKPWTLGVELAMLGRYWYEDSSLNKPWGLAVSPASDPGGGVGPRQRVLTWNWDGDPNKIRGFQVYLNGDVYGYFLGSTIREATVLDPSFCGNYPVSWEVAAAGQVAQSPRSDKLSYPLKDCQAYAMVKFDQLHLTETNDGLGSGCLGPHPCDTTDLYFFLGLNDQNRQFGYSPSCFSGYSGNPTRPTSAADQPYSIQGLAAFWDSSPSYADTFIVPISDRSQPFSLHIWARFVDSDICGTDDLLVAYEDNYTFDNFQQALAYSGCGVERTATLKDRDDGNGTMTYKLTMFPNSCQQVPLGVPLPVPPWGP
jgi:LysM repeat protein